MKKLYKGNFIDILKGLGALAALGGILLFPKAAGRWEKRKKRLKRRKFEEELERKEVHFL